MKRGSVFGWIMAACLAVPMTVSASEEAPATAPGELAVKITGDVASVKVKHGAKTVEVMRNQDTNAVIDPGFAKTSRKCPPFCAQPMHIAPGVEVVGEVEVIHFMATKIADGTGTLVDARTPDWHAKGTIPGSINIPYTDVNPSLGADEVAIADAMEQFGAVKKGDGWDFANAKSVLLWCNGPWCGQSPTAILGLLELGYPAEKILYYRGGMQSWKIFGLTVVPPAEEE